MTIIYVAEINCQRLAVTFKNNELIKVQKLEDVSGDKNIIYKVNPMETFIGKNQLCEMTRISGAEDKEVHDGNTILIKVGVENDKHRYVYIGGDKVCSFLTNDKNYKYISNMGNNFVLYCLAKGWENIYYLTPYFKFFRKEIIDVDDIDKLFDIDHHIISNYQKLRTLKIHSNND